MLNDSSFIPKFISGKLNIQNKNHELDAENLAKHRAKSNEYIKTAEELKKLKEISER